jgi:UDP-2-acetamido-2-deoxy-ribo-hexuluronate aminotransferase
MRQISVHGEDRRYHHTRIGINGRLDTIQAAVLLVKLDVFPREVEARRRIGQRYTAGLGDKVQAPYIEPHNTSVYAQYTIQIDDRDRVSEQLKAHDIPTAVHYPVPLTQQPALKDYATETPVAAEVSTRVMSLPMSPWLSTEDQDRVVRAVTAALA